MDQAPSPHQDLTEQIIGCAIAVHREVGPGLLESVYQTCLAEELRHHSIPFERELAVPMEYREIKVECGYRLDFVVDQKVVLELKSIEKVLPIHEAQLLTYLRITGLRIGLLMNFNVPLLKDGITRRII